MQIFFSRERIPGLPGLKVSSTPIGLRPRVALHVRRGLTLIEIAVVIIVMSVLITILGSLYRKFSVFKSTQDEATLLRDSLVFSRSAAIRSNESIFFEFNMDDLTYRSFRKQSEGTEVKEKEVIKQHSLSSGNAIVGVQVGASNRQTAGKIVVRMYPDGSSDELMIFLGPRPEINSTVIFSRYGQGQVAKGEAAPAGEDPSFHEAMEDI